MAETVLTIFGSGRSTPGDEAYTLAERLGKAAAQAGFTIANGGYGGTMFAAAKAAGAVGGQVIGVTCAAFKNSRANPHVTREIVTHSLDERLDKLIEIGDGFVVLPGGTGTLLELAKVWELKNKGLLPTPKPIVLLGGFWRPVVDLVCSDDPSSRDYIAVADTAEDAVSVLSGILKVPRQRA